jgi:hypothetical protein
MFAETEDDGQIVVLFTVIVGQESELIGQDGQSFLLSEHTDRNEVSKQA